MKEQIKDDLTYTVIGCAMKVHSCLGNGFQEIIYQRALAIELQNIGVEYLREQEMPIIYSGEQIGSRRADFVINRELLVELKALVTLEDVHLAQALNYLVAYRLNKGLLLNFGAPSLEIKRLIYPKTNNMANRHR
jgi:GxxExxY protein